MTPVQPSLFDLPSQAPNPLPEGLVCRPDLVSAQAHATLLDALAGLAFQSVVFQGYEANRRELAFGWSYDFARQSVLTAPSPPDDLLALRDKAAESFGRDPALFEQILVLEYTRGAAMGWHRDRPEFDEIIGVSLGAPSTLRLRRRTGDRWERARATLSAGSAYLLSGPARTVWEHSIPPLEGLRYSTTFRSFRTRQSSR